jgi:hypothetical protein
MSIIRAVLRKMGFRIHKGWRATHRSGYDIQCIGCGERRSTYMLGGNWRIDWQETTESGDGSCGSIKELPIRWGY